MTQDIKIVETNQLLIAYLEQGPSDGWPCIMNHGFPYDVHVYDEVAPILAKAGARVIMPYLRGYGPTKFLSTQTLRSGEQAVLGADLLGLMDGLEIEKAVVGGYDWGGRAACVVSALWPDRVTALITGNSYNIQNIARSMEPATPEEESSYWYQYLFHSERGRNALLENREGFTRLLWKMWSPTWAFDEQTFKQTVTSFENPDFVDVVIHSYRHRYSLVPGDPVVAEIENALAQQPNITVPTIAIDGDENGVSSLTAGDARKFTGAYEYRVFNGAGHNLPQERPTEWAQAVMDAKAMAKE
jgi:pimeloyl-ACP methyl ester carboxylesterase